MLDEHLDYVYAGHQIDPEHPGQTGIKLDALLEAIGSGKSLKRLVLMDTCQSGAVGEKEEMKLAQASTELPHGVRAIKSRALKVVGTTSLAGDDQQRFIEEMFLLPGQHRGINIIGASGGAEYAMESDKWNNGVFTSALIEAMRDKKADMDHRGRISVSDLKTYLAQRVPELTGGAQKPSVVAFEQDQDFDLEGDMPLVPPSASGTDASSPSGSAQAGSGKVLSFEEAASRADAGDAYAQAVVSIYYKVGYKVPIDLSLSAKYAMKSAAQNNPLGIYQLGSLRTQGKGMEKNPQQGLALQKKALEGIKAMPEDPYAITFSGQFNAKNNPEGAFNLYQRAAGMGYPVAVALLSNCYHYGTGTAKNPAMAAKTMKMAADMGLGLAQQAEELIESAGRN
jgi:hypothetical protein